MSLSAEQILGSIDRRVEKVSTPEWGGDVYVRVLSGNERDNYEWWCINTREKKGSLVGIRAKLCGLTLCDETGKRLFEDETKLVELGKVSSTALVRVFEAAQRLNALTDRDVKELEKNSGSPADASGGSA